MSQRYLTVRVLHLTVWETISRSCCPPAVPLPSSKEAMISPFSQRQAAPSSEVLRENCGCTVSWWILNVPWFGFSSSLHVFDCRITVSDPGLQTLAVSFHAMLYRGTGDWNIKDPDLGSDSFTTDPQGVLDYYTVCAPCYSGSPVVLMQPSSLFVAKIWS